MRHRKLLFLLYIKKW